MRFLCVYRPGSAEVERAPTCEEQEAMGKLIGDMAKAGVLLAVEGCLTSRHGARVSIEAGKHSVTDGPFPETKELIAGLCMLQVKSKAEAVAWAKRFLSVVGEGESEIRQLHDVPAAG
jgi:hypothetical protein